MYKIDWMDFQFRNRFVNNSKVLFLFLLNKLYFIESLASLEK